MDDAMNRASIADITIDYSGIDGSYLIPRLSAYGSTGSRTDMKLRTIVCDELDEPQGMYVKQVNAATILRIGTGRFCRYLRDQETGKLAAAFYYNRDYSEVEIRLWKGRKHPLFTLADFEYLYTGFAFCDRLTELGGVVLHGSAIAMNKRGIVFSANSGTGKSTHTQLWKERFGEAVTVVNDDKPAIRFDDGFPHFFGTPWSGKTALNENVRVPLHAIVFIHRADTNRIERLTVKESLFHLTGQIARPYYDSGLGMKTLDRIERLIATVPVYRLHCSISQDAVDAAFNEIMEKAGKLE